MGNESSFCGVIADMPEFGGAPNTEARQSLLEGHEGSRDRQNVVSVTDEVWSSMIKERERDTALKNQLEKLLDGEVDRKAELEQVQRENASLLSQIEVLQNQLRELDGTEIDMHGMRERAQTDREFGRPEKASLWDEQEVWHWLESLHCEEYIAHFAALHIDGNSLVHDVNADNLATEFSVKPLHVPKLQREILKLQNREKHRFEVATNHAVTFVPEIRLEDEITKLQTEIERLRHSIDSLENEKRAVEDQLATYISPDRFEEVEEQLERVIEENRVSREETQNQITTLEQNKDALQLSLDELNTASRETSARMSEEFDAMQSELNARIDSIGATLRQAQAELVEKEKELAKSISEKEKMEAEMTARVDTLEENRERQEQQIKDLQNSFRSELSVQQAKANTEIQMLRTQMQDSMIRFHGAFAELKEIQEAATIAAREAASLSKATLETSEKLVTTKEKETGEILHNWQSSNALQTLTDAMIVEGGHLQEVLERHGLLEEDGSASPSSEHSLGGIGFGRRPSVSGSDSSVDEIGSRSTSLHDAPHALEPLRVDISVAESGSDSDESQQGAIIRSMSYRSTGSRSNNSGRSVRSARSARSARSVLPESPTTVQRTKSGSPFKRLVTADSHRDWTREDMKEHEDEMKREMIRLVQTMQEDAGVAVTGIGKEDLPDYARTAENHLFRHASKGKWTKREMAEMQKAIVSQMSALAESTDIELPTGTPLDMPTTENSPVGSGDEFLEFGDRVGPLVDDGNVVFEKRDSDEKNLFRRQSDFEWDDDKLTRMQSEMELEMKRLTSVDKNAIARVSEEGEGLLSTQENELEVDELSAPPEETPESSIEPLEDMGMIASPVTPGFMGTPPTEENENMTDLTLDSLPENDGNDEGGLSLFGAQSPVEGEEHVMPVVPVMQVEVDVDMDTPSSLPFGVDESPTKGRPLVDVVAPVEESMFSF